MMAAGSRSLAGPIIARQAADRSIKNQGFPFNQGDCFDKSNRAQIHPYKDSNYTAFFTA